MSELQINNEYRKWLEDIKFKISTSRIRIAFSVNSEVIRFYYMLGKEISEEIKNSGWGAKLVEQLSKDLKVEYPDIKGFSLRNLRYMRDFYEFYSDNLILQQSVAKLENKAQIKDTSPFDKYKIDQIPWGHNIYIFTKAKDLDEAIFYINETIKNAWSRDVLALQIKSNLYNRKGKAITNFETTLPTPQSDLAKQTLKDPYTFDFMSMTNPYNELDVEKKLVENISNFLLELGKGFAFIGRQYHLEINGLDYYLDLLFYHTKLKCYVVIELKNTKFKPEYTGKLNFYLSAVDSLIKAEDDNETIGILLCRDKNKIETEFALRGMTKPMGVSEFTLSDCLPENLKSTLPTVEEIELELENYNKKSL